MSNQETDLRGPLSGVTVLELVPSISPEMFGLGYAALHLAAALERAGVNVYLASMDRKTVAYQACEDAGFPVERYISGSLIGPSRFRFAPLLVSRLSSVVSHADRLLLRAV